MLPEYTFFMMNQWILNFQFKSLTCKMMFWKTESFQLPLLFFVWIKKIIIFYMTINFRLIEYTTKTIFPF